LLDNFLNDGLYLEYFFNNIPKKIREEGGIKKEKRGGDER